MDLIPEPIRRPEIKCTKLFINNEWVDSGDNSTFETINPATREAISSVAEGKEADINRAVDAAKSAFARGSKWRRMDASDRGLLLHKIADFIDRDAVYIASLETSDSGRRYIDNIHSIPYVSKIFRYFAGWADKNHGKTIPTGGKYFSYTLHEPIGVFGAITGFHAPMILFAFKVAPCLAMGNVIVYKPAEETPLTSLYLASYFKEAGFPPGVLNVVPGFGSTAGHALCHHMEVDKITFSGSRVFGRMIQKAASETNLKQVTLEQGGKNPIIIFPDVDVESAAKIAQQAVFFNSGQVCPSASKTYVHEDMYHEFVAKSIELAKCRKTGDPFDITTDNTSMVSELHERRVLGLIDTSIRQGGKVRCGGGKMNDRKGFFIQPTILTDLTENMVISEETLGPIQQIYKFKDVNEVIDKTNATRHVMSAGVISNDINNILTVSNGIRVGVVWANCYFPALPVGAPFGGVRESGWGKDLGEDALHEYTQVKTVIIQQS